MLLIGLAKYTLTCNPALTHHHYHHNVFELHSASTVQLLVMVLPIPGFRKDLMLSGGNLPFTI
jgi:hypothetical protein